MCSGSVMAVVVAAGTIFHMGAASKRTNQNGDGGDSIPDNRLRFQSLDGGIAMSTATAGAARLLFVACALSAWSYAHARQKDLRDYGIDIGVLQPGKWNAITDVPGVEVGQKTLIEGDDVRTGVTAILPYAGNLFQDKVPAAVYAGNGFGKLTGTTQIEELGNIETPIVLTNTLSVPTAADALIDYTFSFPANGDVR